MLNLVHGFVKLLDFVRVIVLNCFFELVCSDNCVTSDITEHIEVVIIFFSHRGSLNE